MTRPEVHKEVDQMQMPLSNDLFEARRRELEDGVRRHALELRALRAADADEALPKRAWRAFTKALSAR
jgi:hypothetical protein